MGAKWTLVDLAGQRFGRLLVVSRAASRQGRTFWNCICDCGNTKEIVAYCLKSGMSKSCGCMKPEATRAAKTIHGGTRGPKKTPEYRIWRNMKTRCLNKNNKNYPSWGGRGIAICGRWINDFPAFLADMGHRPSEQHSIERINNDGNYEPSNCRWATAQEQARNRNSKRTNRVLFDGKPIAVRSLLEDLGMNPNRVKDYRQNHRPIGLLEAVIAVTGLPPERISAIR